MTVELLHYRVLRCGGASVELNQDLRTSKKVEDVEVTWEMGRSSRA